MAAALFEAGNPAPLCRIAESTLAVLQSTDHGRSPVGLNEAGLKAVVVAALHDTIAAGGSIMSEVKTGSGGFADLVVTLPNRDELVVIELKHVPAGYCASTEKKSESALTNREAIQRQVEYLKSVTAADMEQMLVTTGARVTCTVSTARRGV